MSTGPITFAFSYSGTENFAILVDVFQNGVYVTTLSFQTIGLTPYTSFSYPGSINLFIRVFPTVPDSRQAVTIGLSINGGPT